MHLLMQRIGGRSDTQLQGLPVFLPPPTPPFHHPYALIAPSALLARAIFLTALNTALTEIPEHFPTPQHFPVYDYVQSREQLATSVVVSFQGKESNSVKDVSLKCINSTRVNNSILCSSFFFIQHSFAWTKFFSLLCLLCLSLHHVEMKQEKHWTINNYLFTTKMNRSGCIRGIYLVWLTLSTGTFLIQL